MTLLPHERYTEDFTERMTQGLPGGGTMNNPMTTPGDVIRGGAGGSPTRVPIGSNGDVLTVSSGQPAWLPPSGGGGFANPMTNQGDIIRAAAAGVAQRLAVGSNGDVLTVVAGQPAWAPPAAPSMVNPMNAAGDLIRGSSGGTPQRLPKGTDGQVLTLQSGQPEWVNPQVPAGLMTNPMNAASDMVVGASGGAPNRLAVGSNGQVLTVQAGAPAWVTPPTAMVNPMNGAGQLVTSLDGGEPFKLNAGSQGQMLVMNGGLPFWQDQPSAITQEIDQLFAQHTLAGINGAVAGTTKTDLASYTMPGGTLTGNKSLRISGAWQHTRSDLAGTNFELYLGFGGSDAFLIQYPLPNGETGNGQFEWIINARNGTANQDHICRWFINRNQGTRPNITGGSPVLTANSGGGDRGYGACSSSASAGSSIVVKIAGKLPGTHASLQLDLLYFDVEVIG